MSDPLRRRHAQEIFAAAVDAVRPEPRIAAAMSSAGPLTAAITRAGRLLVVGGGKAGAGMVLGLEAALEPLYDLQRVTGIVNVPDELVRPTKAVRLHGARPTGANEPTQRAVDGVDQMLGLVSRASPDDVVIALISGGASALLPAPPSGISLADKLAVTRQLSAAGAIIQDFNCVRKHLSRIKGGGLVAASKAGGVFGLIISDVVGDPLDVIGSGPTVADPTTFADARRVLAHYKLSDQIPQSVADYLAAGIRETPKQLDHVHNTLLATNWDALKAAATKAESLGYAVLNLGDRIIGETRSVAQTVAGIIRSIQSHDCPTTPPCCVLIGGETTVTLPSKHGKGGRNQEFVLTLLTELGHREMPGVTILSAGTDGEDGPTDAAGAVADISFWHRAAALKLDPRAYLRNHDAYTLFQQTGCLLTTGLTGTNVMDLRLIMIEGKPLKKVQL